MQTKQQGERDKTRKKRDRKKRDRNRQTKGILQKQPQTEPETRELPSRLSQPIAPRSLSATQ